MVQFNLLPAVKLEYIKARRIKRLVIAISIIASGVTIFIFAVLFTTVNVLQKNNLKDLDKDIATSSSQLKAVPDLNKILTVQNQLNTLTELHDKKPAVQRLFTYVSQLTPQQASLTQLTIDFEANTLTIGGTAPTLDTISTLTDTLKGATFTSDQHTTATKAFKDVVLSSFAKASDKASFTITFAFDPQLFDSTQQVTLQVPAGGGSQNAFKAGA